MWGVQLLIWNATVISQKILLFIVQRSFLEELIAFFSGFLSIFQPYPRIELTFVLFLFPLGFNVMCFWIVDNFLKKTDYDVQKTKINQHYIYID